MVRHALRLGTVVLTAIAYAGSAGERHVNAFGPPGQITTVSPSPPVDADHDGINEDLEQKLAERYAPVIYIEPDESNYPVNVEWFLDRANLQYHEDCTDDIDSNRGPFPIGTELLGPDDRTLWAGGPNCGEDDTGYSHPPHRLLTTIATDPDGQFSVGSFTTGYSDQQTFVLNDLFRSFHVGSTNPRDWKTYFHAYPGRDGGVMIQYWHVFAFNEFGGGFDDHGGDWDASIQVWLKPDLTLRGVWFSRHADDHPGTFFCASESDCGSSQVRLFDSTHPVVTIDGGGHAAFRSPIDWATCDCRVLEGVTGPLGTIVWTRDSDAFDDPAALREADFVCDPDTNICSLVLSDPSGGIVWKTWSDGDVVSSGNLTHPITSPSAHGGLVNLGEYNPCTTTAPLTCFGSAQASRLLAGEFHPLNDAFWLRYEGRWGSIGTINSGPRGPVFQGFEDRGENRTSIYRAWYNNGADSPAADDGNHPWRVPPSTSATLDGASFTSSGGVTFVPAATRVALSASQSAIADRFGSMTTFYRVVPAGGSAPAFASYAGPFAIASAPPVDGPYVVEYFSVDALGNVEPTRTLAITLDTTAPVASIAQPAAISYPHSATLTLDYAVSDGSGAGVSSVTPTMDGAAALPDGTGLASGQAIDLLTELSLGSHAFAVDGVDNVGNRGVKTVTFTVIVTAESIKQDVNLFLAAGKIKNGGLAAALLAKLEVAAAARECAQAQNLYKAFIDTLQALAGKGVDATAAAIMIADAQYLIAHCP